VQTVAALATAHLVLRLGPLNRALRAAVDHQQTSAAKLLRPELAPLCITDQHIRTLLDQMDASYSCDFRPGIAAVPSSEEHGAEADLRAQAACLGITLPLDRLSHALSLSPFEQQTILLCAAPELDRAYEQIYAFILDDLNRRLPCLELLTSLTARSITEQMVRRHALARSGRLRRTRVLVPLGDAPTGLRQEFRLALTVFDFLTGAHLDLPSFCRDHAEILAPGDVDPPPQISPAQFVRLTEGLTDRRVKVLGIWGPRQNGGEDLVLSLAAAMQRKLRRLLTFEADPASADLNAELETASAMQACLWLDMSRLGDPGQERAKWALAEALANSPVSVFVTGRYPWRPALLLRTGAYAEVELSAPGREARERQWSRNLSGLEKQDIESLASRYSLDTADIRSVSHLALTRAQLAADEQTETLRDHIAAACDIVTRRSTSHFASVVLPRRGPDDLVLPANLHRQILEVASFFQLQSRVDEEWGFGRLAAGSGVKVLFTGDPGTGKTLAAEVIASLLRLALCKVDLARIVSKWVGETEKNLESAFSEAEESHAVLFFDEADALFGKRGDVQQGTDRYANLEVSYLLQRLENSRGLVILATNAKDQIDAAFVRRFQIVVHFPRPGLAERRRLWRLAVPPAAPIEAGLDFEALARLEMTGAAIVSSARTAALLAADAGSRTITMTHMIRATARQFRREARVLTPSELGAYGALLQDAS
jgi:hypothetical protein